MLERKLYVPDWMKRYALSALAPLICLVFIRYSRTYTLGARKSIVCSPHPVGWRKNFSRPPSIVVFITGPRRFPDGNGIQSWNNYEPIQLDFPLSESLVVIFPRLFFFIMATVFVLFFSGEISYWTFTVFVFKTLPQLPL